MSYCLENAVDALHDTNPWLLEQVDFEPLEGITDGANRVFRAPHRPLDEASSLTIYDQAGNTIAAAAYDVVSWDSGVVRFDKGVSEQYYADYKVADQYYGASKLKEICRSGFRLLMAKWPQSWYLIDSGGSTFISSTTPTITDPPIGGVHFSTSHPALDTFHKCCEYALAYSRLRQASALDVDYREGMSGGVAVTTHYRAQALKELMDALRDDIDTNLIVLEELVSGAGYGGFVSGAKSDAYEDAYEWWDDTEQAGS